MDTIMQDDGINIVGDSRDPAEAQVYNSKMTTAEFAELAKFCRDPNVLGGNLLSKAKTLMITPLYRVSQTLRYLDIL